MSLYLNSSLGSICSTVNSFDILKNFAFIYFYYYFSLLLEMDCEYQISLKKSVISSKWLLGGQLFLA